MTPPASPSAAGPLDPGAFEAVLFDLDGVLVDSFEVWLEVVNGAARGFGLPPVTRERVAAIFGQGIAEDARNLFPGRTPTEIRAAYQQAFPQALGRMERNPEALEVLARLAARGLAVAIVTNTQTSLVPQVLAVTDLTEAVPVWVGLEPPRREKPAPDLLFEGLARLRSPPSRALMVGDTDYDERAAEAAGTAFLRYELRRGGSLLRALETRLGPLPARAERPSRAAGGGAGRRSGA